VSLGTRMSPNWFFLSSSWLLAAKKIHGTACPIIIGEMEMGQCPDYSFTAAESRGEII